MPAAVISAVVDGHRDGAAEIAPRRAVCLGGSGIAFGAVGPRSCGCSSDGGSAIGGVDFGSIPKRDAAILECSTRDAAVGRHAIDVARCRPIALGELRPTQVCLCHAASPMVSRHDHKRRKAKCGRVSTCVNFDTLYELVSAGAPGHFRGRGGLRFISQRGSGGYRRRDDRAAFSRLRNCFSISADENPNAAAMASSGDHSGFSSPAFSQALVLLVH